MAVTEITKENYETEFIKSSLPVVLDFWGNQCAPCMELMPKYHELSAKPEYKGKIKFCSVETSKNRRVAINLRVMSQPTFLFYKDGREICRIAGNKTTIEAVTDKINEII